jgi:hypothetical protein
MITTRGCLSVAAAWIFFALAAPFDSACAANTAFTYQGQLQQNGSTANGTYSLEFSLFATNTGGVAVAGPVTNEDVGVTNGLFTVSIDFGSAAFTGASNWLQIGVETNGGSGFTTLTPRLYLAPAPIAIFAENVNTSTLSNLNISTATGLLPIGTLPAAVVTNGTSSVSIGSLSATNIVYVGKWVTNSYSITTNDTLLFCMGTNELLTLPASPSPGKMFTVFSKNPNGSVIVTNGTGTQVLTVPGLGQSAVVYLGGSTSPSNVVTVTFDGSNY